jgi:DMSO/TMAO reductase YedYZ molybdopterin-dependent catalytic subunit
MAWQPTTEGIDERVDQRLRTEAGLGQPAQQLGLSRRRLMQLLVAGGAAVPWRRGHPRSAQAQTAPGLELVVKPTPPDRFFDYGTNKEMRWETMYGRGYLVPNDLFFVRNHTRTPRLDVATWRLQVEGAGVERPFELRYDDLLAMPSLSVIRSIECAGNGRSFFQAAYGKQAQGTQWKLGGIGVAEWTGVPLREVLERAGLKRTARDIMVEGLDDAHVRRPIPITKAFAEDTLLVYAMNGDTLPPDHGFPLRLLTPGWVGVANIKWVGRLEVSEQPLFSYWNTETYVLLGPDYQANPPAKGPILSTQSLKSALELAAEAHVRAGNQRIKGRAWSPFGKIARVMYSLDQGQTWQPARLQEPNIARAWVRWDFAWDAQPGHDTLTVRATDEAGNTQPDSVLWNEQGYLYNALIHHPVQVS